MLEYEQQALKIAQETGDVEAECRAYCRLANIHRDLKQVVHWLCIRSLLPEY